MTPNGSEQSRNENYRRTGSMRVFLDISVQLLIGSYTVKTDFLYHRLWSPHFVVGFLVVALFA